MMKGFYKSIVHVRVDIPGGETHEGRQENVALLISILVWSMRCIKIPLTSGGIRELEFEHL